MNKPIMSVYNRLPIEIIKGEGYYLFDSSGKKYIDFGTGIAVVSLGHNNSRINNALHQQIDLLWHCSNIFEIPLQKKLAQRLVEVSFADQVFFCSSGLEAVETAIKLIRKYQYNIGNRYKIVTFENGFHGRSITCLSAGGNEAAREGYGPFIDGFIRIPIDKEILLNTLDNNLVGGVLIEPVQSEGGVYPVPHDFLKLLREETKKRGILLCFDEVQTGFGRTGTLFKYQQIGIEPDIMTVAKAMGNGFPIAACLAKKEIADIFTPGSHGSTFGGNPLAMAVGNAVLDEIIDHNLLQNVSQISTYFFDKLCLLEQKFKTQIKAIRVDGLLIGIEIPGSAYHYMKLLINNGLIVTRAGNDKVIRILPPLTIDRNIVDEAISILEEVFKLEETK